MSLETRSSSALFKRAEQLRRWEESETNREPVMVNGRPKKIKFSAGCVFLAACKAGDREEILRLLKKGADIDTHDVDGLSALHQACIDDNLELVEFLVENGADVNKGDNEGWTPLHATASCGFLSIARYLIEKGANVAAVNNDGELPVDVSESNEMEDMLQQELEDLGIDPDSARNEEERLMLADAKNWLSSGYFGEKPHPKSGATALHVAAAKGYLKVMDILIKAGADVNAQDFDGWTPLHAAAHWGQKEAAEILAESHCNMGITNCVGQTAFDVAENEMVRVLEDLKKKQATLPKVNYERLQQIQNINKISVNQKAVISDGLESKIEKCSDKEEESENSTSDKVPPVHTVELHIQSPTKHPLESPTPSSPENPRENQSTVDTDDDDDDDDEVNSLSTETSDTGKSSDVSGGEESETEKKNRANKDESLRLPISAEANKTVPTIQPQNKQNELEDSSWRRPGSFRTRLQETAKPGLSLRIGEKESPTSPTGVVLPSRQLASTRSTEPSQEVSLRRTQSFEADKTYRQILELRARVQAGSSCPALHSTPMRSASLKERRLSAREEAVRLGSSIPAPSPVTTTAPSTPVTSASPISTSPQATAVVRSVTPSTPTTPGGSKLSPANIFKNFFKSFVPPVRDEESETQRKAHAKRVRETRRSTQGVTLEEIKSAEQLVKKKQQEILQQATQQLGNSDKTRIEADENLGSNESGVQPTDEVVVKVHREAPPTASATLTNQSSASSALEERRPSWRLRVDNGSKFMLEDARKSESNVASNSGSDVVRRTAVAIPVTETGDTTVTLPLRKPRSEEKDEKENESRNAQATQAAIQRRRRPKRRSTGVVHVDMDEIDPDRHSDTSGGTSPSGDGDSLTVNSLQSGGESEPPSRLQSEPHESSSPSSQKNYTPNGEIDYKKLYEESMVENERLRSKLKLVEEELAEAKATAEKNAVLASRNSMTESEKRERRAMERKLSEMEEELKQLDQLKCENQRLRDENGALIRVISKLSK